MSWRDSDARKKVVICFAMRESSVSFPAIQYRTPPIWPQKKKKKKKKEKDTSLWSLEPFYAERIQKLWWPITLSVLPWSRLCSRHNALLVSAERYKQTHALKQTHLCIIRLCWESISIAMMTRVSVTYFCQDCSYNLNRYQNPAETCQLSPATETTSGNSKFFFFTS